MRMDVVLTVSESKRLIARGVARHPAVLAALADGTVAVGKGTTNAYVAEELLGHKIDKPRYVLGAVQPAGTRSRVGGDLHEVILKKGEPVENISLAEAIRQMGAGDVLIKGANALNYAARVAGVLIGHPTGGTIGSTIGCVIARRITLIIPVGLEKNVATDIRDVHMLLSDADEGRGYVPTMWPIQGEIFTEIEALEVLSGVGAAQIGAGGVGGAEGAVRLLLYGNNDQIDAAARIVESVQGEPPFV